MIRLYLVATLVLSLLLALLSTLAMSVGTTQSLPNRLAGFAACDVPCWYGVMPGVTTRQQAWQILVNQGYRLTNDSTSYNSYTPPLRDDCDVQLYYRGDLVSQISLTNCSQITMGDLMTITGAPSGVLRLLDADGVILLYQNGAIASQPTPSAWAPGWRNPYEEYIGAIHILAPSDRLSSRMYPWHGFVARWRYCQLEPLISGC